MGLLETSTCKAVTLHYSSAEMGEKATELRSEYTDAMRHLYVFLLDPLAATRVESVMRSIG